MELRTRTLVVLIIGSLTIWLSVFALRDRQGQQKTPDANSGELTLSDPLTADRIITITEDHWGLIFDERDKANDTFRLCFDSGEHFCITVGDLRKRLSE